MVGVDSLLHALSRVEELRNGEILWVKTTHISKSQSCKALVNHWR